MMFPKEGMAFLATLAVNNNREWFLTNKINYETYVKRPASNLATAIAEGLSETLSAAVDYKIFRINRDVRFSKDKTPYNSHVRFAFWDTGSTTQKGMGGPAFYLSIESEALHAGAGCMAFPPNLLTAYRNIVADNAEVVKTVAKLEKGGARFDPPSLKRVPNGFEKDHPHTELLKRKGLTCWIDETIPTPIDISPDHCLDQFQRALPIYRFVHALA